MNSCNPSNLCPEGVWNAALLPQEEPLRGQGELRSQYRRQFGNQVAVIVQGNRHAPVYQHSVDDATHHSLMAVKTRLLHNARMTLAERITAAYKAMNISQADAARLCGWSAQRFGQYANGKRTPDLQSLMVISDALNTTPDHLLGVSSDHGGELTDILGILLELEGLDPETSRTIAEAASATQQVLRSLPDGGDDHERARLAAQAVWTTRRLPKPGTKLGQS